MVRAMKGLRAPALSRWLDGFAAGLFGISAARAHALGCCIRCRRAMLAPQPDELCATCLHAANAALRRRRDVTAAQPTPQRTGEHRQ